MDGGRLKNNKLLLLAFVVFGFITATVGAALAASPGPIAVLLSDSDEAYLQPAAVFAEEVGRPVRTFDLQGDIHKDPALKERLFAEKPSLIFALGAKAAFVAKIWTKDFQDIPVIFAMVLNWERYNLLEQKNMAGIASQMAPGTQFANMTMISPAVKRIGVVYSEHSQHMVLEAQKAASLLGLQLIVEPIARSKEFRRSFNKISPQVDAYWVLNDPVIYTLDNLSWLKTRCVKNKLICVGQSQNIAEMGLVLAVNPDVDHIGTQAASMAKNILHRDQKPKDIGVMAPLGTQLFVNLKTADSIGLEVSPSALDLATNVIR
jgi:putative ABC transport system substrate-binding protein